MPKNLHPHVSWRDGRPRFQPGRALRAEGFAGTDLRWPDPAPDGWRVQALQPGDRNGGRWFSRGEAVDWSAAFLKARRAAAKKAPAAAVRAAPQKLYTVAQLFEDWYRSPKFQLPADPAERRRLRAAKIVYAEKTVADFKQKARVIEAQDLLLWNSPVDALDQVILFGLYEDLVVARGIATARGVLATLSIALGWGKRRGRFTFKKNDGVNPARDLQMATPPPRIRFGTRTEIEALVATADAVGRPEFGDMVLLGVWTGQRQADRLQLEDHGLHRRRRLFRQAKTNAIVAILEAPELERRLAASAERRRAARAEALLAAATPAARAEVERRFKRVILNELVDPRYGACRWQPWGSWHYGHAFGWLRDRAVAGVADAAGNWIVKPCPSLGDFHEADLRDTAVTWMALAGATIPEIISVTGHTAQSATTILKHYLAQHPEMADAAIGKMIAWFDAGGETEIGL